MTMFINIRLYSTLFLTFFCAFNYAQDSCKIIIFEPISFCPDHRFDNAILNCDSENYDLVNDSTYASYRVFAESYRSLDVLDSILILIESSLQHLDFLLDSLHTNYSHGPESKSHASGSLQVRVYNEKGELQTCYVSIGFANTEKWLTYLHERSVKSIFLSANRVDLYFAWLLEALKIICENKY